jgi:hypothetical protein
MVQSNPILPFHPKDLIHLSSLTIPDILEDLIILFYLEGQEDPRDLHNQ